MIMNSYAWDIYGMLCKNFENMIEILMHIYIYISVLWENLGKVYLL